MKLTAYVFAWNEVASLEKVVNEVYGVCASLGEPFELVIIDDGSTDGTSALADSLAASRAHVRVIHHEVNKGLGGVYRTGFTSARGDFLTFFPADGQFPADIIARFFPMMERCDLVLGYLESRAELIGRALSTAERVLYRILFGKMPKFQGVFMLRRSVLDEIELRSDGRGWGIVMEMILRVHRGRYRVESVLTEVRPRMAGKSKVQSARSIASNLKQLLELRALL